MQNKINKNIYINEIIFGGIVASDLFIKENFVAFNLAFNKKFFSEQDNKLITEVCYIDCVFFGKKSIQAKQRIKKGDNVIVFGYLYMNTREEKQEIKIRCRDFQDLSYNIDSKVFNSIRECMIRKGQGFIEE